MSKHLGFSGRIARAFQDSPLTPVLALAAILLGLTAAFITPREEEPQIDVTMANVMVPFPGADVHDVENLVDLSAGEEARRDSSGVKHIYSVSRPGMAMITVEFKVGVPRQTAIVRLYNQVMQNRDFVPPGLGVGQPLIRAMGIDDVPVMGVTLWSDDPARSPAQLAEVAHSLETALKRVPGTRDVYTIGAPERAVVVQLQPARLAAYGLAIDDLVGSLKAANVVTQAGERVTDDRNIPLTAGTFLADAAQIRSLVIGLNHGQPVFLSDVAQIHRGADLPDQYAWFGTPPSKGGPATGEAPAVTLAIAKKSGTNAADITTEIRQRLKSLRGAVIPADVHAVVTRDYGQTATDKANKLIEKLAFATFSVVLLVLLALGWREAIVVGSAVIITLLLTLFASWAMGFTINRVSLFALIFSIGILVDDAIVVVENIHRHMALGGRKPARGHSRSSCRGWRAHHPGDLHGHCGAAADGLRVRPDGPVHAAHPDQRLGRHAVVAGGGAGGHAVAGAAPDPSSQAASRERDGRIRSAGFTCSRARGQPFAETVPAHHATVH